MKIGVLGIGKIGQMVLNLLEDKYDISFYTTNLEHVNTFKTRFNYISSMDGLFDYCDLVFIAIKPQTLKSVITKQYNFKNKCVVSFAAGIPLSYLENIFLDSEVVRLMPNIYLQVGKSMTTYSTNNLDKYRVDVLNMLDSFGFSLKVTEEELDKALPLNGSMPAYLYTFIKYFVSSAKSEGLDDKKALDILAKTLIGSGYMLLQNNDLEGLITSVCSKGGTTIAGLEKLDNEAFKDSIEECYKGCINRNKELKK